MASWGLGTTWYDMESGRASEQESAGQWNMMWMEEVDLRMQMLWEFASGGIARRAAGIGDLQIRLRGGLKWEGRMKGRMGGEKTGTEEGRKDDENTERKLRGREVERNTVFVGGLPKDMQRWDIEKGIGESGKGRGEGKHVERSGIGQGGNGDGDGN